MRYDRNRRCVGDFHTRANWIRRAADSVARDGVGASTRHDIVELREYDDFVLKCFVVVCNIPRYAVDFEVCCRAVVGGDGDCEIRFAVVELHAVCIKFERTHTPVMQEHITTQAQCVVGVRRKLQRVVPLKRFTVEENCNESFFLEAVYADKLNALCFEFIEVVRR